MEAKRKRRVYQPGSDDEDALPGNEGTACIAQMIQIAHVSTRSQVKSVVEEKTDEIKSDMNELKRDVQNSRETERYVAQKHSDQAGMLRVLNRRLKASEDENSELKKQIMDLKHRLGRHEAFQDCVDMNGDILDTVKEIKEAFQDSVDMNGDMLNIVKELKNDLKGIKKKLRTTESD